MNSLTQFEIDSDIQNATKPMCAENVTLWHIIIESKATSKNWIMIMTRMVSERLKVVPKDEDGKVLKWEKDCLR